MIPVRENSEVVIIYPEQMYRPEKSLTIPWPFQAAVFPHAALRSRPEALLDLGELLQKNGIAEVRGTL